MKVRGNRETGRVYVSMPWLEHNFKAMGDNYGQSSNDVYYQVKQLRASAKTVVLKAGDYLELRVTLESRAYSAPLPGLVDGSMIDCFR